MTLFWIILVMGLTIFVIRFSFIYLLKNRDISPTLQKALRFVPAAVFFAIIFPAILSPAGTVDISFGNPRLLAGVLAIVLAWLTKSMPITIILGLIALIVLQTVVH